MENCAIYAGSFDPFTNGHLDIVLRALRIFSKVHIVIAHSVNKKSFMPFKDRKEAIAKIFAQNERIVVDSWEGLLVDYAKSKHINTIVRGLRPTGDFEIEFQMATMNRKLNPDCETVFLATGEKNYYISSSLVKEVYSHGGDISEFVPICILDQLKKMKA